MRTIRPFRTDRNFYTSLLVLLRQYHLIVLFALLGFGQHSNAQCIPAGDQTSYGSGSWIGYVYSNIEHANPPASPFTATYRGFVTQPEIFDQNLGAGAISGVNVCGSYTDLMAYRFKMTKNFPAGYYTFTIGGDDGVRLSLDGGSTYTITDWNYHSYQTSSATVFLSGSVNLVLENYDQGGESRVSFSYTACTSYSTAPTAISGTSSICSGTSTTLTATGGTSITGTTYQWGTGATVGSNIISGQTSESITVSPTTTTTYWVRRLDPSPCNTMTSGVNQAVNVTPASTAPTSITGTTTLCLGNSATLTATGGTLSAGAAYEWGTGTVGSNIITGQTAASLSITPATTTTYWVRRTNVSPCLGVTSAATVTVTVNIPGGNQTSYGSGSWIGYVYTSMDSSNPPSNAFTAIYRGFVTQPETFDQNLGSGPLSGPDLCGTYSERFSTRFKMQKNFAAGYYTFTVGGDDGYRLSLDGGATFAINNFVDHGYATSTSAQFYLSGNVNLVLEYYEQSGDSRVSFSYVACTNFSTAPTSISGTTSLCNNTGGTNLTVTGGYEAPGATYQWGTGTAGSNIIAGATGSSYYINPAATTTYWVRRVDGTPCNLTTTAVSQTITVAAPSTNPPSITTPNSTVCSGATITLTANGGTAAPGSTYQWGTGYTAGSNIISGQTAATISITPTASGGYWVRRVDVAPCNTQTSGTNITITVNQPSVAPTSIAGVTTSCSGTNIQLTAVGGTLGTNATYQWGTGTIGNNIIAGATNISYYPSPTTTTTYWVRIVDGTPCNANTSGVTQTVTVSTPSTNPNIAASATTVCSGANVTLTASAGVMGTGAVYQWGSGSTVGSNIISGQTGTSIVVNPTASGSYWVRRVDPAPCNTQTAGSQIYINVNQPSIAPTSVIAGATSLCFGTGGTTLTANGGTLGSSASYQWGTGTVGSNIIAGANSATYYINPAATTTYWVRIADNTPCNTNTAAVSITITATSPSTAPTGTTASATAVCSGASVTLTATGGVASSGSTYQWGTGYTVGSNVISGTTVSIVVNPTVSTVYWVRRTDPAPCNTQTGGPTVSITVNALSTEPTAISGGASATCPGTTYTLTATGGTAASGATYQWGTGSTVGSNVIAGQTGVSISVTPSATTTYWVRRYDGACTTYTNGVTTTISITPAGDPSVFGNNVWNVYGYSTGDITLATAVYAGSYAVSTLGVDTQNGTNSWASTLSPSSSAGWIGCTVPVDNFTMTLKRSGFPCGTYTIAMSNWDDATQVYINGALAWSCTGWSGGGTCTGTVGSYTLDSASTIEIRVRENSGNANVAMTLTKTSTDATPPTSISGTTAICSGNSTTLTATGGTLGTSGSHQWGTGTLGHNIIAGQTAATINVNPSVTTTYWVRRVDSLCSLTTAGVSQTVTVNTGTTAGTLSTPTSTICRNNMPSAISLAGNVGNIIKWQYANDAAFTSGVTDIASTNSVLSSADMGSINTTRYYRAVVQYGSCDVKYTAPITVTVPAAVTYNGSWSATPTATSSVIISSNLTLTSNLNVCSCQISGATTLTVNSGSNLIVQTALVVDPTANIIVKDKGSIVQVDDSAINLGKITVERNSKPMKLFDYTYWSSPVQNWKLNELSPSTLADKYFSFNSIINNWAVSLGGVDVMVPGKGYIVRAPQGWSLTNASLGVYQGQFTGVPNTGIVAVPIIKGAGTMNLIGNPYPSAIDIDQFLTDPANAAVVNGTVYLWTHNTAISSAIPGNSVYNYTADDYAKYNLTGGVTTAVPAISGGVVPDGKIASGQGFFIEAKTGLANGTYTANFKNAMRLAGNNDRFYRVNAATVDNSVNNAIVKNRIWINISNALGAYNQVLIGYLTGATDGYDSMYDGKPMATGNVLSMYSLIGTDGYSIQGKALPFVATDVVPIGFKTSVAGNYTIAIENFDGLFQNQNVYLVDKLNNVTQNLKAGSYEFATEAGTFDNRFEIRYTDDTALATNNPLASALDFTVYANHKQVFIHSTKTIESVQIYDLLGREIYNATDINARNYKTQLLNVSNQVVIVKVKFENDQSASKKVILD